MAKLYKRGKVWWFQFRNRRVSTRCTDRKAAELAARDIERRAADPSYRPANQTTLGAALKRFKADREQRGRAEGTIQMIDVHVAHIARVLGEHTPLAAIAAPEVDHYISVRRNEGARSTTIGKELSTLRGSLRIAARRDEYHRPLESVMPQGFELEYTPRDTALTEKELRKLLDVLEPERAAVCAFIVATAADWRSVEQAQAQDFDRKTLRVLVRGSKTAHRWRVVPVPAPFRWLVRFFAGKLPFEKWGNVRRDLEVACRKAGVTKITPRDLRRTHGKILRAKGVEPHLIGAMLGHADSRMVERVYGRLPTDALERLLAERLGTGTRTVQRKGAKRRSSKKKAAA